MTIWTCACRTYTEMPRTDLCLRCGMPVTQHSRVSVEHPRKSA